MTEKIFCPYCEGLLTEKHYCISCQKDFSVEVKCSAARKTRCLSIKLLNRTILIMLVFICLKSLCPPPIGIFVKSALSEMLLLMFLLNFITKKNMISILGFWNQKIWFQHDYSGKNKSVSFFVIFLLATSALA